jgi:methylthioribose-1-phosphate isomerase
VAPALTEAFNPVFDATPAKLISAIVCERGVARAPTRDKLKKLLKARR